MQETLWNNSLNCVKDVPKIQLNIIPIATVFLEEKIGVHTFVPKFVNVDSKDFILIPYA